MKKLFSVVLIGFCAMLSAKAEVEFSYEAGAEVVSSYIWRGQYNGGLSLQPSLAIGFEGEHTALSVGAWGSVGASDWGFRKEKEVDNELIAGTYFVPELDIVASFSLFNITIGLTHYYYCDGGNFFGWKDAQKWSDLDWSSSTTELSLGYNCADFLPENHNLYVNWYTMVAGNDFKEFVRELDDIKTVKNYSSYLELGYDYTFEDAGVTIGAQIGMVPWASDYYGTEDFAVQHLSLRLGKTWELGDLCEIEFFGQGVINPSAIAADPESIFVKASGDDKIGCQTLNGTVGLGIWF